MAFQMTAAAAREVLEAAERSGAEGMALRIAAKPTAEGVAFGMGFDEEAPGDEVVAFGSLTVLIAANSRPLLDELMLDFAEVEGGGREFIFTDAQPAGGGCATQPGGCSTGGGCSRCG